MSGQIVLQNKELVINILDPIKDQNLFGSRYCTGCYVWQIHDKNVGDLLTGPQYPMPTPSVFDGQGMPDAFETAIGPDLANVGEDVLVIGVGLVRKDSPDKHFHTRHNPRVTQFCIWDMMIGPKMVRMHTVHDYRNYQLHLTKKIHLDGRVMTLTTLVENSGEVDFPIRHFAHPFFPINHDFSCCDIDTLIQVPQNDGFYQDPTGTILMRPSFPWENGCYKKLEFESNKKLTCTQYHPKLGSIKVECLFPVAELPIWANKNTFSFEPYFESICKVGSTLEWSMKYHF